jgi:hypothetical protein
MEIGGLITTISTFSAIWGNQPHDDFSIDAVYVLKFCLEAQISPIKLTIM